MVRQAHHERLMMLAFHPPFVLSVSKGELFCVSPDQDFALLIYMGTKLRFRDPERLRKTFHTGLVRIARISSPRAEKLCKNVRASSTPNTPPSRLDSRQFV